MYIQWENNTNPQLAFKLECSTCPFDPGGRVCETLDIESFLSPS